MVFTLGVRGTLCEWPFTSLAPDRITENGGA
jgi:hypothetical protein